MNEIHSFSITLGDMFNDVFKNIYNVNEDNIYDTVYNPDRFELLKNSITLYYKKYQNYGNKNNLLVALQLVDGKRLFAFSYWIPDNLLSDTLLQTLINFVDNFGLKLKHFESISKYYEHITLPILISENDNPLNYFEILGPQEVACQTFMFYKAENKYISELFYVFSINQFKYEVWLHDLEMVELNIQSKWKETIDNLVECLESNGKTKFEIFYPNRIDKNDNQNNTKIEFDCSKIIFPKIYETKIKPIIDKLNNLSQNKYLIIKPIYSEHKKKCIFCGSDKLSKEHIIPKWLRTYFPDIIFDNNIYTNLTENKNIEEFLSNPISSGHKQSAYGYTIDTVCLKCNNTWMSEIQNKAKEIFVSENNLKNDIDISSFCEKKLEDLSLWLLMIVLLLFEKTKQLNNSLIIDLRNELSKLKIRDGLLFEQSTCDHHSLNFVLNWGASKLTPVENDLIKDNLIKDFLNNNYFVASLQIGKILFRVSYLPENNKVKRKSFLKETKVLYPHNYKLDFTKGDEDIMIWNNPEHTDIQLNIFSFGLVISQF